MNDAEIMYLENAEASLLTCSVLEVISFGNPAAFFFSQRLTGEAFAYTIPA